MPNHNQHRLTQPGVRLLVGEPKEGEHDYQIMACNDYLRMGRGRSLSKLARHYKRMIKLAKENNQPAADVPCKTQKSLENWSSEYGWVNRSQAYDAMMEERRNMQAASIMEEGFAQTHQRVAMLDELVNKVAEALAKKGLYGIRHKGLGLGDNFQVIQEEEFRRDEIRELRGLLDDLAMETGGRQKSRSGETSGLAQLLSQSASFTSGNVEDAEWEPVLADDEPHTPENDPESPEDHG